MFHVNLLEGDIYHGDLDLLSCLCLQFELASDHTSLLNQSQVENELKTIADYNNCCLSVRALQLVLSLDYQHWYHSGHENYNPSSRANNTKMFRKWEKLNCVKD